MARPKRKPATRATVSRTFERIAIAAIAAIATRARGESVAFATITIFVIVVVIEELSRRWVWHGKRVTLRDVALSAAGDLRIQRARARARDKQRARRSRARPGRSDAALNSRHAKRRRL